MAKKEFYADLYRNIKASYIEAKFRDAITRRYKRDRNVKSDW